MNKLNKLILNHNELEILRNGVFIDCNQLSFLDLGHNKLKNIEENVFINLPNLEIIILSFNKFDRIPRSLSKLNNIKTLDLSNNQIKSVEPNILVNSLEIINFESNQITSFPDEAFVGLSGVKELNLKDNYLSDLNAKKLVNDLKSLKTIKLNINDFVCTTLRALVQEFETKNIKVAQGFSKSNVTVNGIACKLH